MKTSVALLLLAAASAAASDTGVEYIRKEVEWGTPLNLEIFGGPHIEVFVRNREISYVTAATADFTRMVSRASTNIQSVEVNPYNNTATVFGTTSTNLQPTKNTRSIQKKNGTRFPGSDSTMYLLYQEPTSGIRVYFLDTISKLNHDSVVIAVPKPPPPRLPPQFPSFAPVPLPSTPPPSTPAPNAQKDGQPISPELFTRYIALQKERESLDTSNPEAVALFNQHAADYHAALKKAQNAKQR